MLIPVSRCPTGSPVFAVSAVSRWTCDFQSAYWKRNAVTAKGCFFCSSGRANAVQVPQTCDCVEQCETRDWPGFVSRRHEPHGRPHGPQPTLHGLPSPSHHRCTWPRRRRGWWEHGRRTWRTWRHGEGCGYSLLAGSRRCTHCGG